MSKITPREFRKACQMDAQYRAAILDYAAEGDQVTQDVLAKVVGVHRRTWERYEERGEMPEAARRLLQLIVRSYLA